jgi:uncharacterized membrane protein YbhN (UPF0104 family)
VQLSVIQRGIESLKALAEQDHRMILPMMVRAFSLSFLYFSLIMAMSFVSYQLFSIPLGAWAIVFVSCLLQLISLIPIGIFGGLGVNDISLIYLYGFFGLPQSIVPAIAVGFRILGYLSGILGLGYLPVFSYFTRHKGQAI